MCADCVVWQMCRRVHILMNSSTLKMEEAAAGETVTQNSHTSGYYIPVDGKLALLLAIRTYTCHSTNTKVFNRTP